MVELQRRIKIDFVVVFALTLLAVVVRAAGISDLWLNPDEGIYFLTATRDSLGEVLRATVPHAHPPLFYVVLWLVSRVSLELSWLRLPSLLAGSVFPGLIYLLVSRLAPRWAAAMIAIVAALAPGLVVLSQTIRPYPLLLVLLPAFFFAASKLAVDSSDRRAQRWFCWTGVLLLFVHYAAVLVLVSTALAQLGSLLSARCRKERLAGYLRPYGGIGIAFLLVSAVNLQFLFSYGMIRNLRSSDWLEPMYAVSLPSVFRNFLGFLGYTFGPLAAPWFALLVVLGLVVLLMRRQFFLAALYGLPLLVAALAAAARIYPFGGSRHSIFLVVPVLALVGAAADGALRNRLLLMVSVLGFIVTSVFPDQVYRAFGTSPSEVVLHPYGWEQVVSRREIENIAAAITSLSPHRPIALDEQTFQLLAPLLQREPEAAPGTARIWSRSARVLPGEYRFGNERDFLQAFQEWCRSSPAGTSEVSILLSAWGRSNLLNELAGVTEGRPHLALVERSGNIALFEAQCPESSPVQGSAASGTSSNSSNSSTYDETM